MADDSGADALINFPDLLDRSRQGDHEALMLLVQHYEREVRLVARVLLGPALRPYLDSIDLVQSVHRSLMIGLNKNQFVIGSPENLLALALTIVRRKVARQWRHLQRQQRLETRGGDSQQPLPDLLVSISSPRDDPALAAQFKDQVRTLCLHLNESEQTILEMRLNGYSTAEIAEHLGLSPVALRVRMTRLRQRLQEAGVLDDCL